MASTVDYLVNLAGKTLSALAAGLEAAVPKLVTALIFFTVAYVAIKVVLAALSRALRRAYPADQQLVARLWVTIVGIFLWFGAALVGLNIVGLGAIAASLGTGAGFLALGVSYALSEMIEDAVAGVYLLRDPDFNPGDRVTAQSFTGTIRSIELRKSRIELDNRDVVVIANRDVESRWTHVGTGAEDGTPAGA